MYEKISIEIFLLCTCTVSGCISHCSPQCRGSSYNNSNIKQILWAQVSTTCTYKIATKMNLNGWIQLYSDIFHDIIWFGVNIKCVSTICSVNLESDRKILFSRFYVATIEVWKTLSSFQIYKIFLFRSSRCCDQLQCLQSGMSQSIIINVN